MYLITSAHIFVQTIYPPLWFPYLENHIQFCQNENDWIPAAIFTVLYLPENTEYCIILLSLSVWKFHSIKCYFNVPSVGKCFFFKECYLVTCKILCINVTTSHIPLTVSHAHISYTYTVHRDTRGVPITSCDGVLFFLRDSSRAPDVWELSNHDNLPLPLMVQHGKDSRSGDIYSIYLLNNILFYCYFLSDT